MNIFYYLTLIVPKALPVLNFYFPTIHFTRISSLVLFLSAILSPQIIINLTKKIKKGLTKPTESVDSINNISLGKPQKPNKPYILILILMLTLLLICVID